MPSLELTGWHAGSCQAGVWTTASSCNMLKRYIAYTCTTIWSISCPQLSRKTKSQIGFFSLQPG